MPKWAKDIVGDGSKMGRGRAVWLTAGRWIWVQHAVTEIEWELVQTDRGMAMTDTELSAAADNVIALDGPLARRMVRGQ